MRLLSGEGKRGIHRELFPLEYKPFEVYIVSVCRVSFMAAFLRPLSSDTEVSSCCNWLNHLLTVDIEREELLHVA